MSNPSAESNHSKSSIRTLSSTQIIFAVVVMIGLMVAINFSSRIVADQNLADIRQKVVDEIDLLKREQAELIHNLSFVSSDEYVAAWARSEGKMILEGEVLIVPVPSNQYLVKEDEVSFVTNDIEINDDRKTEPWRLWWALFFDQPPPEF